MLGILAKIRWMFFRENVPPRDCEAYEPVRILATKCKAYESFPSLFRLRRIERLPASVIHQQFK